MKLSSLYTDESAAFVTRLHGPGGHSVQIRFQIDNNDWPRVSVELFTGGRSFVLEPVRKEGGLLILQTELPLEDEDIYYFFGVTEKVVDSKICLAYTKEGISENADGKAWFRIKAEDYVPEWCRGAVVYQIFTDRFRNGNPKNNVTDREYFYNGKPVQEVREWDSLPEITDVGRMYGGDLAGVRQKLDYLMNLGVEVLYFNPIFVSPSSHKYDVQDYDHIDPHLTVIKKDGGKALPLLSRDNAKATRYRIRTTDPENLNASNEWFADFVSEIHKRGMKIILDGVFNHCGSFNRWMDREGLYDSDAVPEEEKGAYRSEKSRYRGYFAFDREGNYEKWWGIPTLPKLNYENSEELVNEIIRIGKKWLLPPYNIDGWRLDVAADLGYTEEFNHRFWKRFRDEVRAVKPDAVVLAEHYGDPKPWLSAGEWDTVMNYDAFMDPVSFFLTGVDKHSDVFRPDLYGNAEVFLRNIRRSMLSFDGPSLYAALNQLDNHDHSRFLTRTNKCAGKLAVDGPASAAENTDIRIMRQGIAMLMTWPGAPGLYYGDEAGVSGWTDPDDRRPFPWGHEDWELTEYVRESIAIHRSHPALTRGTWIPVLAEKGLLVYGRRLEGDVVITVINTLDEALTKDIDVSAIGINDDECVRLIESSDRGYSVARIIYRAGNGRIRLELPPVSALVIGCTLECTQIEENSPGIG